MPDAPLDSQTPDPAAGGGLDALRQQLAEARQTIASLERREKIDRLLAQADPVDLEVARLMTEAAVQLMDEPDLRLAIEDLRRHKPFLFRRRGEEAEREVEPASRAAASEGAAAMPARVRGVEPRVQAAARRAIESGDRRDLLRYLRLRRTR